MHAVGRWSKQAASRFETQQSLSFSLTSLSVPLSHWGSGTEHGASVTAHDRSSVAICVAQQLYSPPGWSKQASPPHVPPHSSRGQHTLPSCSALTTCSVCGGECAKYCKEGAVYRCS
jgi:hypothetical protein